MLLHEYTANLARTGVGIDGVGNVRLSQMEDKWMP